MANKNSVVHYSIDIAFEEVKQAPFGNILILCKNSLHGKVNTPNALEMLVPDGFEVIEVHSGNVEALFVSKKLLKKIPRHKILDILEDKVFPLVSVGELINVDLNVSVSYPIMEKEL